MSNYLITGATGYVGQEIVRQLLAKGDKVTALNKRKPKFNIEHISVDIRNRSELFSKLENAKFDYILHVASLPGDTGNPQEMVEVNVNGVLNMLELARKMEVKRFVLSSSVSAYEWYPATKFNPPDYLPVDEEHPCRPKDMYCGTKRMQEILAMAFYHEYGVPAACLRLTAVVGPDGQGGGSGWRKIAEQLAEGVKVQIPHFTFEERCHYVDIRDVARMHIHCAEHDAASGQIFNCVGPKSSTGYDLADAIHKYFPDIEVVTGFPWSQAQGGQIEFSMEKAKHVIGFVPEYTIEDSIKYIKEWIDNNGLLAETGRNDSFVSDGIKND